MVRQRLPETNWAKLKPRNVLKRHKKNVGKDAGAAPWRRHRGGVARFSLRDLAASSAEDADVLRKITATFWEDKEVNMLTLLSPAEAEPCFKNDGRINIQTNILIRRGPISMLILSYRLQIILSMGYLRTSTAFGRD